MTAVLAALRLLPAVLAIVGMRIDALRVRPPCSDDRACHGLWARLGGGARIARKPLAGEGRPAALAILVPLHHPAVLVEPGPAGRGGDGQVDQKDGAATPGIVATTPMRIDRAGTTACFTAISQHGPSENATADLVDTLGSTVIPKAEHGTNMRAEVGGSTAAYEDLASTISADLPPQIMVVIALGFALLVLAFRTSVVPALAAVANVLSIAGAHGARTAIFQFGWLSRLVGLTGSVPIVCYVPLFMFAMLSGLSVDCEVFLVSQIPEHVNAAEDSKRCVVSGLVSTARVAAAALIMVFVFGSFLLDGNPTVKQFGVGLAVAVMLDATVVRCLLVPALMILLGGKDWCMLRRLDRLVPHVNIGGSGLFDRPRHAAPAPARVLEPGPVA